MALWGNLDSKSSTGTVSLNYDTLVVTGSGTSFGEAGSADVGDIIRFGDLDGVYHGDAIIVGITSVTQLKIASTSNLSGVGITAVQFSISQLPKFTTQDSHYKAGVNTTYSSGVYGVDANEVEISTRTEYSASHAGWVGVTTYLDWEGNVRVRSEVFVAASSIQGDYSDDVTFPDISILFTRQPQSVTGVASTATVILVGEVSVLPTDSSLTYRWQSSPDNITYSNISNNAVYSGATSNTLGIANTNTSLNNYRFRLVVTSGITTVTSNPATITFAS
jgi:hypothetical protein